MRRPAIFFFPDRVWWRFVPLAFALAILLAPAFAHAIDNARTAVTLVQQAAKSYEAGDFVKAADLYEKAWRLDPSPAYLWALARAEHLAGVNESAIDHYRQFIANPGTESARVTKAQAYLAEVEQEVNKTRLREADAATRSGNPALAAELYLQAYRTAPRRFDWLFKAAVAEQMAENFQGALQHLDTYLSLAPPDADARGQASARDAFLRQKLGLKPMKIVEKTVPNPEVAQHAGPGQIQRGVPESANAPVGGKPMLGAESPLVSKPAQGADRAKWPGWTAVGGGVVALAGGVVLLIGAQADATQLARDQNHDPGQLLTNLSHEVAQSRARAINTRAALGWTATGLGLAASGFGVWWLTRHPEQAAIVVPTQNGAQLAVRF